MSRRVRWFAALGEAVGDSRTAPREFDVPALGCQILQTGAKEVDGFRCELSYRDAEGTLTKVCLRDTATSRRAERLFSALDKAGARAASTKGSEYLRISALKARTEALSFEDEVEPPTPLPPNVHLEGGAATSILDAMKAAGVSDDDGPLVVHCRSLDGRPRCDLLVRRRAPVALDPAASAALWAASTKTAGPAGECFAQSFTYDGTTLRFFVQTRTSSPSDP